jgi:hypothetical protein
VTPGALRLLAILLAAPLLAGCAADTHLHDEGMDHGAGGGIPPSVLVGVENKGSRDLAVRVVLTAPNGTVVWEENFTAGAGNLPEKRHELGGEGIFTLDVAYSVGVGDRTATSADRALIDTGECAGLTHLTFVVRGSDAIEKEDVHRECHE